MKNKYFRFCKFDCYDWGSFGKVLGFIWKRKLMREFVYLLVLLGLPLLSFSTQYMHLVTFKNTSLCEVVEVEYFFILAKCITSSTFVGGTERFSLNGSHVVHDRFLSPSCDSSKLKDSSRYPLSVCFNNLTQEMTENATYEISLTSTLPIDKTKTKDFTTLMYYDDSSCTHTTTYTTFPSQIHIRKGYKDLVSYYRHFQDVYCNDTSYFIYHYQTANKSNLEKIEYFRDIPEDTCTDRIAHSLVRERTFHRSFKKLCRTESSIMSSVPTSFDCPDFKVESIFFNTNCDGIPFGGSSKRLRICNGIGYRIYMNSTSQLRIRYEDPNCNSPIVEIRSGRIEVDICYPLSQSVWNFRQSSFGIKTFPHSGPDISDNIAFITTPKCRNFSSSEIEELKKTRNNDIYFFSFDTCVREEDWFGYIDLKGAVSMRGRCVNGKIRANNYTLRSTCENVNDVVTKDWCSDNKYGHGLYFTCIPYYCFGVNQFHDEVCSGKGECVSSNKCKCQYNYRGSNCSQFRCFGIDRSENNVCSSRGTCVAPDSCSCSGGYLGSQCESWNCAEIARDSRLVCSSRGSCIAPDVCECFASNSSVFSYFGKYCEIKAGKSAVLTTKRMLLMAFEISSDSYLNQTYGLEIGKTFDCQKLVNVSSSEKDLLTKKLFAGKCVLSNINEMMVVPGQVQFLRIFLGSLAMDDLAEIMESHKTGLRSKQEISVDIYGVKTTLNLLPPVSVLKNHVRDLTMRTFYAFEQDSSKSHLVASPESELCREKLLASQMCIQRYECYFDLASEKYVSVGYAPHSSHRAGFFYVKHYFSTMHLCVGGTEFSKYKLFSPVSCYGTVENEDNFVIYEDCVEKYAEMFFQTYVVAYFGVASAPLLLLLIPGVLVLVLCCFFNFVVIKYVNPEVGEVFNKKKKKSDICSDEEEEEGEETESDSTIKNSAFSSEQDESDIYDENDEEFADCAKLCFCIVIPRVGKSTFLLALILFCEGLQLWFATQEFLSTDDIDKSNHSYILLSSALTFISYVIWISIAIYLLFYLVLTFVYVNKLLLDPFFFIIGYGSLKEFVFYRVFKASFMLYFFCLNIGCYIVKFGYLGSPDERLSAMADPFFWMKIILPELLLLMATVSVLSYNGVSSYTHCRKLRKLNYGKMLRFPRVRIPVKLMLNSTDEILGDIFQGLRVIDTSCNVSVKDQVAVLDRSSDYGHLSWDYIEELSREDVKRLKKFFFPAVQTSGDYSYFAIFQHHSIISWKWTRALCVVPYSYWKKKKIQRREKRALSSEEKEEVEVEN